MKHSCMRRASEKINSEIDIQNLCIHMAETERVPGHGGSRYCELSSIYVNSSLNCTFKYFVRMGCVNAHGYTINDSFKYQT